MTGEFWDCHTHVFGAAEAFALSPKRGYTPPVRTLEQLEAAGSPAGIGHIVLVQPSVYGFDHACLLAALAAGDGRHRAVAVVEPGIGMEELRAMHAAGVRGLRFNLSSPAGNRTGGFESLAQKIAPLGWHVQFYVEAHELPLVEQLRQRVALPFVIDHFGSLPPGTRTGDPGLRSLLGLLERGDCWVKLSGFYRIGAGAPPYAAMHDLVRTLARTAPERLVWGSDWPHTWFFEPAHGAGPAYADTLAPLRDSLAPEILLRVLRDNPRALYT